MIHCILVDDESDAIEVLKLMLELHCPGVHVQGTAQNIDEARSLLEQYKPQLMFLDIQMPGGSGIELLESYFGDTSVVFTTAHGDQAINAIRLSAFDFLLKPIDHRELTNCMMRFDNERKKSELDLDVLMELWTNEKIKRISVPTKEGFEIVNLDSLLCCEAARSYTIFHISNGSKIVSAKPIGEYAPLLPEKSFIRVHRSFLVNVDHIKTYKKGRGGELILSNGLEIEVSRNKKKALFKRLG